MRRYRKIGVVTLSLLLIFSGVLYYGSLSTFADQEVEVSGEFAIKGQGQSNNVEGVDNQGKKLEEKENQGKKPEDKENQGKKPDDQENLGTPDSGEPGAEPSSGKPAGAPGGGKPGAEPGAEPGSGKPDGTPGGGEPSAEPGVGKPDETPGGGGSSGAIWTSDEHGVQNGNVHYESKPDVYLHGHKFAYPGTYYVKVTDPSGKTLLGMSEGAPIVIREDGTFDGDKLGGSAYVLWDLVVKPGGGQGFDDTPNNGGVYKVWVSSTSDFDSYKTDNFKAKFESTETASISIKKDYISDELSSTIEFEILFNDEKDMNTAESLLLSDGETLYPDMLVEFGVDYYIMEIDEITDNYSLLGYKVNGISASTEGGWLKVKVDEASPSPNVKVIVENYDITVPLTGSITVHKIVENDENSEEVFEVSIYEESNETNVPLASPMADGVGNIQEYNAGTQTEVTFKKEGLTLGEKYFVKETLNQWILEVSYEGLDEFGGVELTSVNRDVHVYVINTLDGAVIPEIISPGGGGGGGGSRRSNSSGGVPIEIPDETTALGAPEQSEQDLEIFEEVIPQGVPALPFTGGLLELEWILMALGATTFGSGFVMKKKSKK